MSNLFLDAISAMSKLSVQPEDGSCPRSPVGNEAGVMSAQSQKEKLVIPKVKREAFADQSSSSNRECAPGSARNRASIKHSKGTASQAPETGTSQGSADTKADQAGTAISDQGAILTVSAHHEEQSSPQGESAAAPTPHEIAPPQQTDDFAQERYDMAYRGPSALQGMLEAITEAQSCQASPVFPAQTEDGMRPEPNSMFSDEDANGAGQFAETVKLTPLSNASTNPEDNVKSPVQRTGTLVMFDQVFYDHRTGKGCQECPERMEILCGGSGTLTAAHESPLDFEQNIEEASMADILRVHDWEYISELHRKCSSVASEKMGKENSTTCLDPPGHPQDTNLSAQSYRVAATAAGAVCRAVDRVMEGRCQNAFVAARPPGHHAGPRGLVHTDDGRPSLSQGFCLLNSVAIGAAYCKYNYRKHGVKRIAIVDFDIHNGDGTAACVRNLTPHQTRRRIGPGMALSMPSYKPWLDDSDADNVLFASMHLCANNFYPRMAREDYHAGSTPEWEAQCTGQGNDPKFRNVLNIPLRRTSSKADAAALWRAEANGKLLPALTAFAPDFILLSAGFDGHFEDVKGNSGLFHLVEEDYAWLTARLCDVAERCCGGRLVSVLEGGYHTQRPAPPPPRNSRRKSVAVPPPPSKPLPGALATSVSAHVKALQAAATMLEG